MKQTEILAELAAKENIQIEPADAGSVEDVLGPFNDALFVDDPAQQSPESAALDAELASGSGHRVAVIPPVDRQVDAPVVRGPIDVRVGIDGSCHIKIPG